MRFGTHFVFWVFMALVVFVVGSPAGAETPRVGIGVIAPLSGNAAHIGEEISRTLQVLGEQLEHSGCSYRFSFLFEDGKAATDSSPTTAFRKLVDIDKAGFVISATSGETMQIGALAEKEEVLVVAVFSSHKDVKNLGEYVFRTFVDVERGIDILTQRIRSNQHTPMALLTEDHAFNRGIHDLLLEHLGSDIAVALDYEFEESDIRPVLLKSAKHHPKSYYLNCSHPATCANAIKQARQLGITEPVYSFLHPENPEFLTAAGSDADGMFFLGTPVVKSQSSRFKAFQKKYLEKYPEGAKNDFLRRTTYDAVMAIVAGVEAVGPNPTAVKDYLKTYRAEGALGNLRFDRNGDVQGLNYIMKEIKGGQVQCVKRIS